MTLAAAQAALLRLYGDPVFRAAALTGDRSFVDDLAPAEQEMLHRLLDAPDELKRFGREISSKKLTFLSARYERALDLLPGLEAAVSAEFHRSWVLTDGGIGDDVGRFAALVTRVAEDRQPSPAWTELVDLQRRQAALLFDPPPEPGGWPDEGPPATLDDRQILRRAADAELVTYRYNLDQLVTAEDLARAPTRSWPVALVPHRHQPTVRTVTLTSHLRSVLEAMGDAAQPTADLVDSLVTPLAADRRDSARAAARGALRNLAVKGVLLPA